MLVKGLYLHLRFHFLNSASILEILYKPILSLRLLSIEISMLDYHKEFPNNRALYLRLLLQDYGIKDRASAMYWRSSIGATFVYC
jgi:hypothetical protein